MFRKMSEALTFQLVKNKILDIESYEIWAYSIEIILLNGSILLGCLLISFMLGEMTHMLSFVLFFIPLRMLVGGYHCRKSETCFFCTLLVYGASTLSIQLYETEIMEEAIWILAVISILIILIWSPLVNPNHLLEDYQIRRNKNIIYVMVVIDVALYGIFCKTNIAMAHSEMMFIILVALTLLAGVMKNKRIGKNEFKRELYKKLLPIQKYVKKLENDFIKQNLKNKTDEQVKNEWTEELEKIKAKAVKNQNFQELQHDEKIDSKFIK